MSDLEGRVSGGEKLLFGPFELGTAEGELRRNGRRVHLQPQPLRVLAALASRAGRVVTREELRREIWGDHVHVDFDRGLNYAVRQIRAALRDDASQPTYIETIPKLGYRFVARVERTVATPETGEPLPARPFGRLSASRLGWAAGLGAAALLAVSWGAMALGPGGGPSRASLRPGAGQGAHPAGRRPSGDPSRPGGTHDPTAGRRSAGTEDPAARPAGTSSPAARDAWLRGRYHARKETPEGLRRSLERFEEALKLDPGFVEARAAAAGSLIRLAQSGEEPFRESLETARRHAQRALEMEPDDPEALLAAARVDLLLDADHRAARRRLERVVELRPGDAEARHWLAWPLAASGDLEGALRQATRAVELDPLSKTVNLDVGWYFYYARRYDEAIAQCRRTLDLEPGWLPARQCLQYAWIMKGAARRTARETRAILESQGRSGPLVSSLEEAVSREGLTGFWRWSMDRPEAGAAAGAGSPVFEAARSLRLDGAEAALETLEAALDRKGPACMAFLAIEPLLDPLHGDPRFEEILRRLRLEG